VDIIINGITNEYRRDLDNESTKLSAKILVTFQTFPSIIHKNLVSRLQIRVYISIANTNLLMLFSELIGTCENHMKHKNTCVNSVKVLLLQQLVVIELNYSMSITLCHPGM